MDPRLRGDDVEWVGKAEFQLGHDVARRVAGRAGARPSRGAGPSSYRWITTLSFPRRR